MVRIGSQTMRERVLAAVRLAAMAGIVALCGCVQPPRPVSAAAVPAVPAGKARIWMYREYEPNETLARPYIRLNGGVIAVSEPGGSLYRDVAPGPYSITVDTVGLDVHQFADISLAAGQTVFIKIESAALWESDLNYRADTFYTRLIPPQTAEADLARSRFYGGG
jgi:hypothetical protein